MKRKYLWHVLVRSWVEDRNLEAFVTGKSLRDCSVSQFSLTFDLLVFDLG